MFIKHQKNQNIFQRCELFQLCSSSIESVNFETILQGHKKTYKMCPCVKKN